MLDAFSSPTFLLPRKMVIFYVNKGYSRKQQQRHINKLTYNYLLFRQPFNLITITHWNKCLLQYLLDFEPYFFKAKRKHIILFSWNPCYPGTSKLIVKVQSLSADCVLPKICKGTSTSLSSHTHPNSQETILENSPASEGQQHMKCCLIRMNWGPCLARHEGLSKRKK